ncbi:MAG: DUF3006 domain-containing protein [Myxococcales bacterium]|nr:DUF3006 domain-containing protein [Myxococcales bacterium]
MWVVDRIEGSFAVIVADGLEDTFDVPLAALPPGVQEGDVLLLGADPAATAHRRADVEARLRALSADDDGGDIIL